MHTFDARVSLASLLLSYFFRRVADISTAGCVCTVMLTGGEMYLFHDSTEKMGGGGEKRRLEWRVLTSGSR